MLYQNAFEGMQKGIPRARVNEQIFVRTNTSDFNNTYGIKNTGPMKEQPKTIWQLPEFQQIKAVQKEPLYIAQVKITGDINIQFAPPKFKAKNIRTEELRFRSMGLSIIDDPLKGECSTSNTSKLLQYAPNFTLR